MLKTSLALVLVLAGTAAADVPAPGVYVATQTSYGSTGWDDQLFIHRVTPMGIEKLLSVKTGGGGDFGWSDAKTLWTSVGTAEMVTVQKFVDGKLAKTVAVAPKDWQVSLTEDSKYELIGMQITKTGEVWLELCLKRKDVSPTESRCVKAAYLRVDGDKLVAAAKKPAKVDAYRANTIYQDGSPLAFPKAKAPKGYAVALKKVTVDGMGDSQKARTLPGAVCTGPDKATITWPDGKVDLDFTMKPKKVTWLRTTPALVRISGTGTNPIGEIEQHEAFLLDCKEHVDGAEFFGSDLWGIRRDVPSEEWQKTKTPATDATWSIYSGDKLVGTLPGSEIRFAPR